MRRGRMQTGKRVEIFLHKLADLIFCLGWLREDDSGLSRRDLSHPSFVDAMVSGYGRVGGFLDRLGKAFDWAAFEALLSPIHGSAMGAPGYPPLTMFKIVLLQQWHTLSDPAAEEAVRDRLSFRPVSAACRSKWRRPTMPRSGGFARRSTSSACRQSSWPGGQPPARRARPCHQTRHAGGRDHHR